MKNRSVKTLALMTTLAIATSVVLFASISPASATTHTVTAGNFEEVTIPAGITEVTFELQAGDGQDGDGACGGNGGSGAYVTGTLAVSPGDTLILLAGKDGDGTAVYGGEGGSAGGGEGGDATYVYLNGSSSSDIVIAAGAGGGGGAGEENGECSNYGGAGGNAGMEGSTTGQDGFQAVDSGAGGVIQGGVGGTNEDAGTGGEYIAFSDGTNGTTMGGGAGGDAYYDDTDLAGGGGGGSGLRGGGGGAGGETNGGGGGAGASYLEEGITTNTQIAISEGGNPHATITYDSPEESTTTTTTPLAQKPNDGDGNNDGIEDEHQSNVHTVLTNNEGPNGNTWVTFSHPVGCDFDSGFVGDEAGFDAQDSTYSYPANFFGFEIDCPQPTVTVEMYFHGLNGSAKDYIPRKYLSYNDTYITLEGASVTDVTIDSKNVIKVVYSITDGGIYDNDQEVNGTIVDPASIAYSPVASSSGTLPATGNNAGSEVVTALMLLLGGAAIVALAKRQRRYGIL